MDNNRKRIIKLKEDTFFFPTDEGTYFRNNNGYFIIKGKKNYKFIKNICEYLNGEYTLDEILEDLDEGQITTIKKVVEILDKNKFIKYLESENYSNTNLEGFKNEINFLNYYTNQGINNFRAFSQFKIELIGEDELTNMIQKSLQNMGSKNIVTYKSIYDLKVSTDKKIIVFINMNISELEEIYSKSFPEIDFLIINNMKHEGIISPFITCEDDWLAFKETFLLPYNQLNMCSANFTVNSLLSSVISFEIFKYVTNGVDSALKENAFVLNYNKLQGDYFKLNSLSKRKDNQNFDFIQNFESFESKYGSPIIEIGRGDNPQIPFSNWEVIIRNNKLLKEKVVEFGDDHSEARLNVYYKALEKLVSQDLNLKVSLVSLRDSQKVINTSLNRVSNKDELTISVNDNKEVANKVGLLKILLKYIINNYIPNRNETKIEINEYLDDEDIAYFYNICIQQDINIDLYYHQLNENLFCVKCSDSNFTGFGLSFQITTALKNAIRTFIIQHQKNTESYSISNLNFKFTGEWDNETILKFLRQQGIDILSFEIKDNFTFSKVSIMGHILQEVTKESDA
ncbi:hypothetical protein [Bacillus sp. FSL R5-0659]|uniref:hypothetical protein n=1 Tax=Bacillus sp. FSL R5-0659 TaxID=2954590 RepID=UPI0030F938F6